MKYSTTNISTSGASVMSVDSVPPAAGAGAVWA